MSAHHTALKDMAKDSDMSPVLLVHEKDIIKFFNEQDEVEISIDDLIKLQNHENNNVGSY